MLSALSCTSRSAAALACHPFGARSFTRRRARRRKRVEHTHYPEDVRTPNTVEGSWLLRHVRPPPATALGGWQRPPSERQDFQLYELVEPPQVDPELDKLQLILTEYVEGIGNRGETVAVERDFGRNELLLGRRAVYASPRNVAKFDQERQKLAESGIFIKPVNKQTALLARDLSRMVVLVSMSLENQWTLEPWHVRLCLRAHGYNVDESQMLLLPPQPISGPDLKIEDSLFRAYLVLDDQLVCPLTCRIHHVSCDESKQLVSGVDDRTKTTDRELRKFGLSAERVYVHHDDSLRTEEAVHKALAQRDDGDKKKVKKKWMS